MAESPVRHTLPPIPEDMKAIYVQFKDGYSAFYFKPMDDEMFNRVAMHMIVEKMKREDSR